ncbi:hypothetical protein BDZ89DRAFT_758872 [Hymenopellis radicata]|nr:hypothetical protein BDZ89DRAFT_758872 [Hymenopellis radicata]
MHRRKYVFEVNSTDRCPLVQCSFGTLFYSDEECVVYDGYYSWMLTTGPRIRDSELLRLLLFNVQLQLRGNEKAVDPEDALLLRIHRSRYQTHDNANLREPHDSVGVRTSETGSYPPLALLRLLSSHLMRGSCESCTLTVSVSELPRWGRIRR